MRVRRGGVEREAVRQDEGHRVDGAVGVLGHAAAHAAGVVGKDAAHHAGVNRGGIGSDAASVRLQRAVEESSHDAGLCPDEFRVVFDAVPAPMLGNIHQNPVRHGLTGETGPCRAEGHGDFVLLGEFEQCLDFPDGVGLYHRLRHEPKIRGVVGVGDAVNQAGMDAGRVEDLGEPCGEFHAPIVHLFETAYNLGD